MGISANQKRQDIEGPQRSVNFATVLNAELDLLAGRKDSSTEIDECEPDVAEPEIREVLKRAHEAKLVGLAFSGGGIRSATFNLGVLQGLAKHRLLRMFHYLSTVSGGGYIGGWLQAWIQRRGLQEVQEELAPDWIAKTKKQKATEEDEPGTTAAEREQDLQEANGRSKKKPEKKPVDKEQARRDARRGLVEPKEIRFLRQYSNYLTPRLGWFGADLWTAVAIYLRNFVLNLVLIVAAFGALLLACQFLGSFGNLVEHGMLDKQKGEGTAGAMVYYSLFPGVLLLACLFFLMANLRYEGVAPDDWDRPKEISPERTPPVFTRAAFLQTVILGFFLVAVFGAPVFEKLVEEGNHLEWGAAWVWGAVCAAGIAILLPLASTLALSKNAVLTERLTWLKAKYRDEFSVRGYLVAICTGFVGGVGFYWASTFLDYADYLALADSEAANGEVVDGAAANSQAAGGESITDESAKGARLKGVFFPPIFIGTLILSSFVYVGLMGRTLPEQRREWWSRLNGFSLVWAISWIAILGCALYGHESVTDLSEIEIGSFNLAPGTFGAWVLSTIGGVFAARTSASREDGGNPLVRLAAKVAPYIFVVGLFIFLSWAVAELLINPGYIDGESIRGELARALGAATGHPGLQAALVLGLTAALALATLVISRLLDVNQFSMHMMYRNRLGRCYLGASNRERSRHPFTGFDPNDDIEMSDFLRRPAEGTGEPGPYPIINTALNLVAGQELAWQKRKAGSFVFTPRYCGYDLSVDGEDLRSSYFATSHYASSNHPVELGLAMAVSGAAASPNMGYHTSPATAFLLTIFNVRLGWWIGNPAHRRGRRLSSPGFTIGSLLFEMFGLTKSTEPFVYLSDGGHFENLGIYELVRRRCRFILACDAEQDAGFKFNGLGNAIEKCRSDLGVEIKLNVDKIRHRDEQGKSEWHWAVGTIDYGRPEHRGIIVYIKSSLTGDAPEDVMRYAAKNPVFPHQSTGDQWFDETQFESYRRLGLHIVEKLLEGWHPPAAPESARDNRTANLGKDEPCRRGMDALRLAKHLFHHLKERWYPPSEQTETQFSRHANSLMSIFDQLRNDENLAFLSLQIYPEWRQFVEQLERMGIEEPKKMRNRPSLDSMGRTHLDRAKEFPLPVTIDEFRHGFYLCNSMIQLMEEVYLDLELESEYDHPDNRGWMNLFRHWSWSSMFRVTWTVSASTYGARFQKFCERQLDLSLGEVGIEAWDYALRMTDDQAAAILNFHEASLFESLKRTLAEEKEPIVAAFTIDPMPGMPPAKPTDDGKGSLLPSLRCGFCVIEDGKIVYFRIQDHVRKMGLARQCMQALFEWRDENDEPLLDEAPLPDDGAKRLEGLNRELAYESEQTLDFSEVGWKALRHIAESIGAQGNGDDRDS